MTSCWAVTHQTITTAQMLTWSNLICDVKPRFAEMVGELNQLIVHSEIIRIPMRCCSLIYLLELMKHEKGPNYYDERSYLGRMDLFCSTHIGSIPS